MALHFNACYAEAVMDAIDRSIIYCRNTNPGYIGGFTIYVGRLEFKALQAWHNEHMGNFVINDNPFEDGRDMTLFGFALKYDKKYESLIQLKGTTV